MDIKKSIMQEHLSERNRSEMIAGTSFYEMGISKIARQKKEKKKINKIQYIADGIELANTRKDIKKFFKI